MPAISFRPAGALCAVTVAAAMLSAGCSKTGTVTGKVTLPDGSPLPGGIITFIPEDTSVNPVATLIKEDGTYTAERVPVGNCKVAIDNRTAGQKQTLIGMGGMPSPPPSAAAAKGGGPIGMGMKGKGGAPPPPKKGEKDLAEEMREKGKDTPGDTSQVPVPGKAVPINAKYFSGDSSGLTVQVSGGTTQFDVKLEK